MSDNRDVAYSSHIGKPQPHGKEPLSSALVSWLKVTSKQEPWTVHRLFQSTPIDEQASQTCCLERNMKQDTKQVAARVHDKPRL